MTPTGSLKRWNRDICTSRGRSGSSPNRALSNSSSEGSSAMFLSLRGSMLEGDDELGVRQGLGKLAHGENAGVVFFHIGPKGLPDGAVGTADVDVRPPDPLALSFRARLGQRRRLGIVDDDDVGALKRITQLGHVSGIDVEIDAPVLFGSGGRSSPAGRCEWIS